MDIGMLWYDDDHKRPLNEKVARAVDHYRTKYGVAPTVCFVNPVTLRDGPEMAAGVHLRSARNVMIDHFWIGVAETAANGNGKGHANGHTGRNGRRHGKG
jgi:hypothetical protein